MIYDKSPDSNQNSLAVQNDLSATYYYFRRGKSRFSLNLCFFLMSQNHPTQFKTGFEQIRASFFNNLRKFSSRPRKFFASSRKVRFETAPN
jgi:hypothetical protein